MIAIVFRTELKLLARDRGFLLVSLLLVGLVWFAGLNGVRQWQSRNKGVAAQEAEKRKDDAAMIALATKVAAQGDSGLGFYDNPLNPMAIGWKHPRLASFVTGPMSVVSTGQSDIYRHTSNVSVYEEDAYQPDLKEMRSPIQQMLGFFDLSVVLLYLLPLLALGISYNLVAGDRENGNLPWIASQGINLKHWLGTRLLARYCVTMVVFGGSVTLSLAQLGILPQLSLSELRNLGGFTALYGAIWFSLSFLVNLRKGSSAEHGFLLVVLWAFALLIVPGGSAELSRVLYPLPSRVSMINQAREAIARAEDSNDQVLQRFYQRHPHLKPAEEVSRDTGRGWFMSYFAVREEAWYSTEPLRDAFDRQLENRGRLVDMLGVLSPAIPFSLGTSQISGTSRAHYLAWQEAVAAYSLQWREFVFPKVFHDEWLNPDTLEDLPRFTFDPSRVATNLSLQVWLLVLQLLVLLGAVVLHPTPRQVSPSP